MHNEGRTKVLYIVDVSDAHWIIGVPEDYPDDLIFRAFKEAWKKWGEYIDDLTVELHTTTYEWYVKDALQQWDIMYDFIFWVDRKVNLDYMSLHELLRGQPL
jgi:hypothetical protein